MNTAIEYIEKITIDKNGIVNVKPKKYSFNMIYRSAMGIHWDNEKKCLFHYPSLEWDALQWYKQILLAVNNEYGVMLEITTETIFEGIDTNTLTVIKELNSKEFFNEILKDTEE